MREVRDQSGGRRAAPALRPGPRGRYLRGCAVHTAVLIAHDIVVGGGGRRGMMTIVTVRYLVFR